MKCSRETREDRKRKTKKRTEKGKQRTNGINGKYLQIRHVNPAKLIIISKETILRVPIKRQTEKIKTNRQRYKYMFFSRNPHCRGIFFYSSGLGLARFHGLPVH